MGRVPRYTLGPLVDAHAVEAIRAQRKQVELVRPHAEELQHSQQASGCEKRMRARMTWSRPATPRTVTTHPATTPSPEKARAFAKKDR